MLSSVKYNFKELILNKIKRTAKIKIHWNLDTVVTPIRTKMKCWRQGSPKAGSSNILSSFRASRLLETQKLIWMITHPPTSTKFKNRFPKRRITKRSNLQNCIRFTKRFRSRTSCKILMRRWDSAPMLIRAITENTKRIFRWIREENWSMVFLAKTPSHRSEIWKKDNYIRFLPSTPLTSRTCPE